MTYLPYSDYAKHMVDRRIEKEAVTLEEFTIRYENQSTSMAKLLLIIFVFLMAVPIALLNLNKKMYFVDHLMVSLEFNSIFILVGNVILPWLTILAVTLLKMINVSIAEVLNDNFFSVILSVLIIFIFVQMERRVYASRLGWALVKSILLLPMMFGVLQLYRGILFIVTLWTV